MKFTWPVDFPWDKPYISQYFGQNLMDYSSVGLTRHNGLDFPRPLGSKIYAVHDGWIVEQTSKETGYGLRITQRVEADGKFYLVVYGHMQRLENPTTFAYNWNDKSKPVKAGDVIGYVNSTGFSSGNHVHLGLAEMSASGETLNKNSVDKGTINPLPFFTGTQNMTKKFLINDGGKIGTLVLEGFTGSVSFAKDEKALAELKDAFEFDGREPMITLPQP